MAIISTGSVGDDLFTANSGTQTIVIPADAEIFVIGVSGYDATANFFSGGTLTIGGAAMTAISGGDANTSDMMGAMFYKVSPATGSQTLAWDWSGTNTAGSGTHFVWRSYKGINLGGAVRDSDASQQASSPHTSKTLTCVAGDLIVAFSWQFVSANATFTWTGATEQFASPATGIDVDDSWAEGSPSGNQTVSTSVSASADGGVAAIVLIPAGGGGGGAKKRMLAGLLAQRALRV